MCECGCVMNDAIYTLPGPDRTLYVVRLSGGCVSCDAPSGVTIEQYKPGEHLHAYYLDEHHSDGPLPLEKWADGLGVAIVTGMRKHEFVKATRNHLIGTSSNEMGTNGRIDRDGAEVILEEMYDDATVKPSLVAAPPAKGGAL